MKFVIRNSEDVDPTKELGFQALGTYTVFYSPDDAEVKTFHGNTVKECLENVIKTL